MKKKVFVTGSSGFIGSRLCQYLNQNTSYDVIPVKGNLCKISDIKKFFLKYEYVDVLIHLAGAFYGDFQELIDANLVTTYNLLDHLQGKIGKMIFSSSGAVYGDSCDGKESFENDSLLPTTLYGLSKLQAEKCIDYFARSCGVNSIILRFPNVYGPGNEKGVIYNMLKSIEENNRVTLYGDGKQSRNFLHIEDACIAINKAIDSPETGIFNITNPVKTSINNLIEQLSEKYQFEIECKEANNRLKDLLLNPDKAGKALKFKARVSDLDFSNIT